MTEMGAEQTSPQPVRADN